jgi:hypothetical protein
MAEPAATTLSRTLRLPESWAAELGDRRADEVGEIGDATGPRRIVLSYTTRRASDWGVDLRHVKRDLERGMWLRRGKPHRYGERYWLTSGEYELEILSKLSDRYQRRIAFVLQIAPRPANSLPRRSGEFSRRVRFADVRDEEPCDLGDLRQALVIADQREQARQRAAREVRSTRPDKATRRHVELHRLASRRYGALRALLALLAARAKRAVEQRDGEVVAPPDDGRGLVGSVGSGGDPDAYLYVRVDGSERSLRVFDDSLVELDTGQRTARTRVRSAMRGVLTMDRPSRGEWDIGTRVMVSSLPRFAMKQHDRALERFLKGEVEGDWDHLAALLCKPTWLDPPSRPMPPRFICDEDPDGQDLNDEQRRAVAGALATPHAFVIQGPPGTGKTTVICEIVRQLAARGQRVLMLAPTHVAVDEVLRRIGRKPGIRALRLAADEGKVHEDVRRYLPDQVGQELVRSLRRPGPDSDARWQARHRSLVRELEALDQLLAAMSAMAAAADARAAAHQAAEAAHQRRERARGQHRREIEEKGAAVAAVQAELDAAERSIEEARTVETAARQRFAELRRPVESVLAATRALAEGRTALAAALDHEQQVNRRASQWHAWWTEQRQRLEETGGRAEANWQAASAAADAALQRLWEAQSALATRSATPPGPLGRFADRVGIGPTARRTARVERSQRAWSARAAERERWSEERDHVADEQRHLEENVRTTRSQIDAAIGRAQARRRDAEHALARASDGWQRESAAAGGAALPEPEAPAALIDQLEAALAADSGVRLRPELAPPGFHQVRDAVRLAADRRADWERHRAQLDQRLAAARQELVDTEAAHRAADARLTADIDQAEAAVADREADLADAQRQRDDAMTALAYQAPPSEAEVLARRDAVDRQVRVLPALPQLRQRWVDLAAPLSDDALADEVGDALLRAVNLVCATTVGIGGVEALSSVDFDTLIVDEASRVIDSEFLIGAVRAQRWILVGDERQLPPYVDQSDEYHLHALTALHRHERGEAETLDEAVQHLAQRWQEDDEQRQFREKEVLAEAEDLRDRGDWAEAYRDIFVEAHGHFRGTDPDAGILDAMRIHLVRSLLERAVASGPDGLREPLVVQRRMIEPLAAIVREPVYDGRYRSPDGDDLRACGRHPLTTATFTRPVVFLDTSNRPDRRERQVGHGFVNELEARWIEKACRLYERELGDGEKVTVSILCFYLSQARLLKERLQAPTYSGYRRLVFDLIAPIDRIQGQESDLVFLSFCRTHPRPGANFGRWLQDLRRLNVACTRAHGAMVFVGHRQMLERLQGVPAARGFYDHLLGLFTPESDHYLRLSDF